MLKKIFYLKKVCFKGLNNSLYLIPVAPYTSTVIIPIYNITQIKYSIYTVCCNTYLCVASGTGSTFREAFSSGKHGTLRQSEIIETGKDPPTNDKGYLPR